MVGLKDTVIFADQADVHRFRLFDPFRCVDRCQRLRHPGREGAHHRCEAEQEVVEIQEPSTSPAW